jgi:DNA/RNA-binding domain of Phe-tRNA-synthetase-like protein
MKVSISSLVAEACPGLQAGIIKATVVNSETSDALWDELQAEATRIATTYATDTLSKRPAIAGTRQAYKTFGKDPARYRVSSEALCRRAIRGLDLYRINTLVDLINVVSMRSGYSIGGFDADRIEGDMTLGVGTADDLFHGIGRGVLNIEGMPVYRDNVGGVGTPTSDNERTKITMDTTQLLITINAYATEMPLEECMQWTIDLLEKYAQATNIESYIIK